MMYVIIKLQEPGVHVWKDAKNFPEVGYLSGIHRHIFHIKCKKEVKHNDREIEFIRFKDEITSYLKDKYSDKKLNNLLNFKEMSCEMIAEELADVFSLDYCDVLEDNENGAEYIKEKL